MGPTLELEPVLWKKVIESDAGALLELHREHVSPWCVYWITRYGAGDDALVRLLRETRIDLKSRSVFLRQWQRHIPLKNYLNRLVIPVVHNLVRDYGLAGLLENWKDDWILRDQTITHDPDAQAQLDKIASGPISYAYYRSSKKYELAELHSEFWKHVTKEDGKVLWQWEGRKPLRNYLSKVVAFLLIQLYRHDRRNPLNSPAQDRETEEQPDIERFVASNTDPALRIDLFRAIQRLSQERDKIYFCRLLLGLSESEAIAGLTTEKQSYDFKYKANKRLRQILQEGGIRGL